MLISIRVKLVGDLKSKRGSAGVFEMSMNNSSTLHDLIQLLDVPEESIFVCIVNEESKALDYILKPNDEVKIIPPILGG